MTLPSGKLAQSNSPIYIEGSIVPTSGSVLLSRYFSQMDLSNKLSEFTAVSRACSTQYLEPDCNNNVCVELLQEAEGVCLGLQWGKRTISSQTAALHLWCGGSCLKLSTRGYHWAASCWILSSAPNCSKSATKTWAPRCILLCSTTDVPMSINQSR